ncbi:MAG TPA: hypothetical protein VFW78_03530 [Bacteroidia bacterium]|nr:hypothetical protein [Bacteroidia bacterium]
MELNRLRFLMDIQEQIDILERTLGKEHSDVISAKEKFYTLAGKEFANSVIRLVHEQAVEPVIFKQAQEFYGCLGIYNLLSTEVQRKLVSDFVEMEHQKRRDDFERFCVSIYQQLECVINAIYENSTLFDKFKLDRKLQLITNTWYNKITQQQDKSRKGFSLESTILRIKFKPSNKYYTGADYDNYFKDATKNDIKEILQRFRLLVYYLYFDEEVLSEERFKDILLTFEEIKLMRNKTHRGGMQYDTQKQIINRVESAPYLYYLKFHGFLMDFMNQISLSKNIKRLNSE